jgi:hypothetical protein
MYPNSFFFCYFHFWTHNWDFRGASPQITTSEWWLLNLGNWMMVGLTFICDWKCIWCIRNLTELLIVIFVCFINRSSWSNGQMTFRCITWKDMEKLSTITWGCPPSRTLLKEWITQRHLSVSLFLNFQPFSASYCSKIKISTKNLI